MKRLIAVLLVLCTMGSLTACGKTRIVHCDGCGKELTVKENSNMTEDWIIFCKDCGEPTVN